MVFNTGQKMALRAFYFIRTLTKAPTYYYINRSWPLLKSTDWKGLLLDVKFPEDCDTIFIIYIPHAH